MIFQVRRKLAGGLGLLMLIGCSITGCSQITGLEGMRMYPEDVFDEAEQPAFAEAAARLKKLGITGITDELVEEIEAAYADMPEDVIYSKYAIVLTYLGSGTYDYEDWSWTPGNDSVYTFDMEVYNLDEMYTDFLKGVMAIGDGELMFTNIQEDTSHVDWEAGTGTRSVTFDWDGDTYTLTAQNQNDWFDFQVMKQLNKIILEKGGEKQLYLTTDGYQECILFYRDAEWAKEFEQTTGLKLENSRFSLGIF